MIEFIRELTDEDRFALQELGPKFYDLCNIGGKFDMNWFMLVWKKVLASGVGAMWRLHEGDRIIGYFGAIIHPCMFSGEITASETFWFVDPEYRSGSGGARLFLQFLKWAEALKVDRVQSAHVTSSMASELEGFYERLGFKKFETSYIGRIQ